MRPDLSALGKTVPLTLAGKHAEGVFTASVRDDPSAEAYFFGEGELSADPDASFSAAVIGVFVRADGSSALLCVPPALAGTPICYECNLLHALSLLPSEDIKRGKLYPLYEKTSGAVLYTERDGERRYLLIKSESGHIGFPKGHIEYGEDELQNAAREIFEETGLPFSPHPDFRMEYTYTTLDHTQKTGVFFLSHYDDHSLSFQKEEVFADWLVPYDRAMELLNFPEDRVILRAAESLLREEET
ncbi:MAG: NUDIX domain-containing protein [Bacteroides sp.]|nr:NUDIX domain-containing protein [Eubacterium sp.]MCM1417585.1 NUDIX domain-containing protein [Roseburia sp.]MCM1461704.1 NUDIX domain-containing protein [Bacteroides sp.]